jgi:hypothetical protein
MGVVYRARQITLNRTVALKMLTGHYGLEELTRFLAEADIPSRKTARRPFRPPHKSG